MARKTGVAMTMSELDLAKPIKQMEEFTADSARELTKHAGQLISIGSLKGHLQRVLRMIGFEYDTSLFGSTEIKTYSTQELHTHLTRTFSDTPAENTYHQFYLRLVLLDRNVAR
jgi:hypothetical protein